MESIAAREADIIEEFSFFEDWMEKYEHIIALGKELAPMSDAHKVDDNKIKGCQSQVWVHAQESGDGIAFEADSTPSSPAVWSRCSLGRAWAKRPPLLRSTTFAFWKKLGSPPTCRLRAPMDCSAW